MAGKVAPLVLQLSQVVFKTRGLNTIPVCHYLKRTISTSAIRLSTINIDERSLRTKEAVEHFLGQLSIDQKTLLFNQLNLSILAYKRKHGEPGFEIHHFLSKYGRPSAYNTEEVEEFIKNEGIQQQVSTSTQNGNPKLNEQIRHHPASNSDIFYVGLNNALPFVGFGFLDNLIMIVAGDYIDVTFATALTISTMAAAALGNTISDVAGIASAWYIEHYTEKLGFYTPKLTEFQASSWEIRWSINFGRAIGVTVGCLLGMIPLLFLPSGKAPKEKDKEG